MGLGGHFKDYLARGYYSFVFVAPDYSFDKLMVVDDKTIYGDIANFYRLKTENLRLFKQLPSYLAPIPAGDLNAHSLARIS